MIRKKLFIGLEEQYTSKRKTLDGDYADDFFITNLTLFSRNLRKGLELSGSVYNLLNKKFEDPGSLEHAQGPYRTGRKDVQDKDQLPFLR